MYIYFNASIQISIKAVDECSIDSIVLPLLHYRVQLKDSSPISDLILQFYGIEEETTIIITKEELTGTYVVYNV